MPSRRTRSPFSLCEVHLYAKDNQREKNGQATRDLTQVQRRGHPSKAQKTLSIICSRN